MSAPSRLALYRITREGNPERLGDLRLSDDGRCRAEPCGGEPAIDLDHLPWFVQAMRPEGFLGRAFARRLSEEQGLPDNPGWWSDRQLLFVLSRYGDDLPGDLLLGDTSLRRFEVRKKKTRSIAGCDRRRTYPALVEQALAGALPGSSAGGEQPKFAAVVENRHVLVKFSPPADTPQGRRVADLLICEHLALEVLRESGLPAAETDVLAVNGRTYLESVRFDRTGLHGRLPLVSLASLDDEFRGRRDNWSAAANDFRQAGWLADEDADAIRLLDLFGAMIANDDRHYGNLSLRPAEGTVFAPRRFALAPVYDMLPAAYAPKWGELLPITVRSVPDAVDPQIERATELAASFWNRVSNDERLADEWRDIACRHVRSLEEACRCRAAP